MKKRWKFGGRDTPVGLHPEVDGQVCYMFFTGRGMRQEWTIIPVREFLRKVWPDGTYGGG